MTVTMCACTGKILGATNIPASVVYAIADVEGGKTGGVVKEKNGQRSYGRWCISKAFLKDVNDWLVKTTGDNYRIKIDELRDYDIFGYEVCHQGLRMIIAKRKCSLRDAIAIYNGGRNGNRKKVCLAYADRVIALAEAKEVQKRKETKK